MVLPWEGPFCSGNAYEGVFVVLFFHDVTVIYIYAFIII